MDTANATNKERKKEMSNRIPDFMLEEYKQIANAYQDLHAQHNELVKFYLQLVALPATLSAIIIQLLSAETIAPAKIIKNFEAFGGAILLIILTALCLAGVGIVLALVTTRGEAILYVRTVNCVRRYFVENDPQGNLKRYLVLPDFDSSPPFWEGPTKRAFWNVMVVEIVNTAIFFATFLSWQEALGPLDTWITIVACFLWFALQVCFHWCRLNGYEKEYKVKFPSSFPEEKRIGVDLDGVLNDLAGEVIKVAQLKFGLKIDRKEIISHRLQECTCLSSEQVKEIFCDADIFRTTQPNVGAKKALEQLHDKGWIVFVITDRCWGENDWSIAKNWLEENGFKWHHLNLIRANEKANYAKAHKISTFVEDNYETAKALSEVCTKIYLLDEPYNQGELPSNVVRVSNWKDIIKNI